MPLERKIRREFEPGGNPPIRFGPVRVARALPWAGRTVRFPRCVSCRVVSCGTVLDGWIVFRFDGEPPHDPPNHGGCAATRHTTTTTTTTSTGNSIPRDCGSATFPVPRPSRTPSFGCTFMPCIVPSSEGVPYRIASIRSVHPCRDGTSHRRPTGPSNCNAMQCNAVGMDLGRSAVGFSALGEHVRLEAFCRRSHQGNGSTQQNEQARRDGSTIDERHDTTRHDNRTDPIGAFPNTDLETCSERQNVVVKGGRNPRNTQQKTVMETPGPARHGTME